MEERILLKNINVPGQLGIETYVKGGGYSALKKALSMKPEEVIEEVKKSGLRGRGGAGFPAGVKWGFVPKDPALNKYLCVNADEGEPGTFKDRVIIEKDPHLMIEGAIISSYAIGAKRAYIYIRGEFHTGIERTEKAIEEAYSKGFLGKGILGSSYSLDLAVAQGAGAYICGEETALIESIEGKRGNPRIRPPFPAVKGLFASPTIVNNVETVSSVPYIITNGSGAWRKFGTEKSTGTKLFSISGHVKRPGVYEVPMGYPLKRLIEEEAQGMRNGSSLKAVIPGGSSTPVLTAEEALKVNLDYESLAAAGSMLGSGAVIVMDKSTCMVRALMILERFYAHESCGQCSPCREGTAWLADTLKRLENGKGQMSDVDNLTAIADGIFGKTICPLGDAAAMPVQSFVKKFREEFVSHAENKGCTAGR